MFQLTRGHANFYGTSTSSAFFVQVDYFRLSRQPTRTHLANPGLELKRLITTIDFGFARYTEENVSQYAKR